MGIAEVTLVGLACALAQGNSPSLMTEVNKLSLGDQQYVAQIIQEGLCNSEAFQDLLKKEQVEKSMRFFDGAQEIGRAHV